MKTVRIGMIGFGNVGHGFLQAIEEKKDFFRKEFGLRIIVTAITDIRYGTICDPEGLPLDVLSHSKDFASMNEQYFRNGTPSR